MAKRKKTRQVRTSGFDWSTITRLFRKEETEFARDSEGTKFWKLLHLTQAQRHRIARWTLFTLVIVLALIVQDVIMSRVHIMGATTELAAAAIMVLTVISGCEIGSLVALIASVLYYFTGSAPGPYCVVFLTVFGMIAAMFRQKYWHRSAGSIILCAAAAMIAYEIGNFGAGIFLGLTRWDRLGVFFLTGIYSSAAMIPLYAMINKIGQIGGNTWKE